jgi:hypothetical protein
MLAYCMPAGCYCTYLWDTMCSASDMHRPAPVLLWQGCVHVLFSRVCNMCGHAGLNERLLFHGTSPGKGCTCLVWFEGGSTADCHSMQSYAYVFHCCIIMKSMDVRQPCTCSYDASPHRFLVLLQALLTGLCRRALTCACMLWHLTATASTLQVSRKGATAHMCSNCLSLSCHSKIHHTVCLNPSEHVYRSPSVRAQLSCPVMTAAALGAAPGTGIGLRMLN